MERALAIARDTCSIHTVRPTSSFIRFVLIICNVSTQNYILSIAFMFVLITLQYTADDITHVLDDINWMIKYNRVNRIRLSPFCIGYN